MKINQRQGLSNKAISYCELNHYQKFTITYKINDYIYRLQIKDFLLNETINKLLNLQHLLSGHYQLISSNMIRKFMPLVVVLLAVFLLPVDAQTTFQKRYSFSLGENVSLAKFSPDYTLLAVLRQGVNSLFSYNPMTFELIGEHKFSDNILPVDLQLFGNDIIIATSNPNSVSVYQRKVGAPQLTLKKRYPLKYTTGQVMRLRLQKLDQDFDGKSSPTSLRHLIVWCKKSFELLSYKASDTNNPLTPIYDKSYQTTAQTLAEFQFINQKYMIFGLQSGASTGETKLVDLAKPTNISNVDTKLSYGMKSYSVRSTIRPGNHKFIAISHDGAVSEYKAENNNKLGAGSAIINITKGYGFSDSNKIVGFHNGSYVNILKAHELLQTGYPKYDKMLSQSKQPSQPQITIASMPQNDTGQLIINSCAQASLQCFYYYSLCPADEYLTTNALNNSICKPCKINNCSKCLNGDCVMCGNGYWVESAKKCQTCVSLFYGCTSCSQNGKNCHICDTKEFNPYPVDNVCQCIRGNVYDLVAKKCVTCTTKISFCDFCTLQKDNTTYCNQCQSSLNRIQSPDNRTCICNPNFYYQTPAKQCQLCDPYKKCLHCTNTAQCKECNAENKWTLNAQSKCVCMDMYVEVSNQCQLCSGLINGCSKCSSTDKCDTCDVGLFRNTTPTADGKCVCQDGYTENDQKVCVLCAVPGCSNCQTQNVCSVCDTSLHRLQAPVNGKCVCEATYTQNSAKQCVLCTTPGCLNCESQNSCTKCDSTVGFNDTITDGKCKCVATKYLDTNTCKDCSASLLGCQLCSNGSACETCNSSLSFDPKPVNGVCKCVSNFFVSGKECVKCQMICEHCNKCVETVNEDLLTTTVGCAECEDGFEVKDLKCVEKSGNTWIFILIGLALLTVVVVIGVCWLKKKRAKKADQQRRRSKQTQSSLVSSLLKQNQPDYMTSDHTLAGSKKSYQPLFSGNINYSISSQEKESDKKMFNESLRQLERERKAELEKKNKDSGYTGLGKNININRKPEVSEEQIMDKKKQGLFSHRGKG